MTWIWILHNNVKAPKFVYHGILQRNYLRNEFDFWKVHRIMNTSGLLQETRSIHDSMNLPKIEFIAYIYILL